MEVEMGVRGEARIVRCQDMRAIVCAVMLGWIATAQAQQTVLEVIDLKYRSADQIVPMLMNSRHF
jgi:hypothetical protein